MEIQFDRCECFDTHCHGPAGRCSGAGVTILYRVDMMDETGVLFCEACADDAVQSGLFTDSIGDDDRA